MPPTPVLDPIHSLPPEPVTSPRLVSIGVVAFLLILVALGLGWQDWQDFRQQRSELAAVSVRHGVDLIEREYWRIEHQARLFKHVYPSLGEELLRILDQPQRLDEVQSLLKMWFPGYKSFSFFAAQDCDIHMPPIWQSGCQSLSTQGPKLLLDRPGAPLGLAIPFQDPPGEGWILLINREFTPFARILAALSLDGQDGVLLRPEDVQALPGLLARAEIPAMDWVLAVRARSDYWQAQRLYIIKRVGGLIVLVFIGALVLSYLELRAQMEVLRRRSLEDSHARLFEQATHDALTGLYNRYAFNEHFQRLVRQAQREQRPIALLLVDIDYFKQVNDHWGHEAGDELLRKVAGVLGDRARRPLDMAARLGGEEFAVLLEGVTSQDAWALGELLRLHVLDLNLPHPTRKQVSVSIGVSCSGPEHFIPLKDLLERADRALYAAKGAGRNRVMGDWEVDG